MTEIVAELIYYTLYLLKKVNLLLGIALIVDILLPNYLKVVKHIVKNS
jgi:hypothetical protein